MIEDNKLLNAESVVVFFDGKCLFCIRLKLLAQKLDFFRVISFTDLWGVRENFNISKQTLAKEIHLITNAGKIYRGYFAISEIIKRIPLLFPLSLLMNLPIFSYFGRKIYKLISVNRYRRVPCKENCQVSHYPASS